MSITEMTTDEFHGLNKVKLDDGEKQTGDRPELRVVLAAVLKKDEDTLISPSNVKNLEEYGFSFMSLKKAVDESMIAEKDHHLLQNLYNRTVDLKKDGIKKLMNDSSKQRNRCPRFWVVLINSNLVDFDEAINTFFVQNYGDNDLTGIQATKLKHNIGRTKGLFVVRWCSTSQDFEIISGVLFVVGDDCVHCVYSATHKGTHKPPNDSKASDGKPYRRRNLQRLLLGHLQRLCLNLFHWDSCKLIFQCNCTRDIAEIGILGRLGFAKSDYDYDAKCDVPDTNTLGIPFKMNKKLWETFILKSPHRPIGEYSLHDVYFEFYISSGLVDSCQMISALPDPTLKADWMIDIESEALNRRNSPKACGAGKKCFHSTRNKRKRRVNAWSEIPKIKNYAFCMYCQQTCHRECVYSRDPTEDGCVPIDMYGSYRPPEAYGTCLKCHSEMIKGSQCIHNYDTETEVGGVSLPKCNRQKRKIPHRHRCLRCDELVHPQCCTYVPNSMHILHDDDEERQGGFCVRDIARFNKLTSLPDDLYLSEPICDRCRLGANSLGDECCNHIDSNSQCVKEGQEFNFYERCFDCHRKIHKECAILKPNPNSQWNWFSPGNGSHWPGSMFLFCSRCIEFRKFTVIPTMNHITKRMNDPDISPDDIDVNKLVMGCFKEGSNVLEKSLRHIMEFGKETFLYPLDDDVYWEQTMIRLFFYLLAPHLPEDVGLIHDGFNIGQIEKGNYTMTSGWETKAKIIQWVFQAGGKDGKNSRKGHWSLIVYERQGTGTTLGKFGLVRILDSLEEPTKDFYNKMVLSVLTSLKFYDGKKPKKTRYISKFIRQNPNPKKKQTPKIPADPYKELNDKRWVVFEDPKAILLVGGPDCGPITCLEALKIAPVQLRAPENQSIDLSQVLDHLYRPLICHFIGQMLCDGITENRFDYTKFSDETLNYNDEYNTRMNVIASEFKNGWGMQFIDELCTVDKCSDCSGPILEVGVERISFSCYFTCNCSQPIELSCLAKQLWEYDHMSKPEFSSLSEQDYKNDANSGRLINCPACKMINEPGNVRIHHCDGSLIAIFHLPRYEEEEDNANPNPLTIPFASRQYFTKNRRSWTRRNIFPILYQQMKMQSYYDRESRTFIELGYEDPPVFSTTLRTIPLLDDEVPEGGKNESKKEGNQFEDSNDVSDDSSTDSEKSDETGKSKKKTNTDLDKGDNDDDIDDEMGKTKKKRQKKRQNKLARKRDESTLSLSDKADAKVVWDVYNTVPANYCTKDDKGKQLQFYYSEATANKLGEKLFWEIPNMKAHIEYVRDQVKIARAEGNKKKIASLLRQEAKGLKRMDLEKKMHRYDQITRLKYITPKKKPPRSLLLKKDTVKEGWFGKLVNGATTPLSDSFIAQNFVKTVVKHVQDNPGRFVDVPPGAGEKKSDALCLNQENSLKTRWSPPTDRPLIWATQNKNDWKCLYYSTASVLYHFDDKVGAEFLKRRIMDVPTLLHHNFKSDMYALGYNFPETRNNVSWMDSKDIGNDTFVIGQLCANDGGTEHAIGILEGWIFDCNCLYALPFTLFSINQCCGKVGFQQFYRTFTFKKSFVSTKKRMKLNRAHNSY